MRDLSRIIRRANVIYTFDSFQTGAPHVPPYVSSGIVGGCFDEFGFQSRPNTGIPEGRTVLGYVNHYHRAEHGRHIQFPLAVIRATLADGSPLNLIDCAGYRQELDIHEGILTTSYDLYGPTTVTAFASQVHPELFVMRVERMPATPELALVVTIECETSACQNNDTGSKVTPVQVSFEPRPDGLLVRSTTNCVTSEWALFAPGASIDTQGTRIVLRLPPGAADLRIRADYPGTNGLTVLDSPYESLRSAHTAAWRKVWEQSWVDLPDKRSHNIWCRMKYYAAMCFAPIAARPMCPTGLTSNIWGFTFPQDVYYVAESLPRLGLAERALAAMEYWLAVLPDVKRYAKRLLGVEGAYYPWTPPFQDMEQYEVDGITGADSYELHNPAYVAAIVWHYYLYSQDKRTLKRFFPVLEEVFRFYAAIATKNASGTYDTYHEKARGQDEASSTDGRLRNLLCVSWSAEFAARAYVAAADEVGNADAALLATARDLIACGCTRKPLLRSEGIYTTYEGDDRPLGRQKHPVQLNPITFLPMPQYVDEHEPTLAAWRRRFDLTANAKKPLTLGWTFGAFALASSRMRAPAEFERDLSAVQPCRGADPRWIQFYESSFQEGWHLSKAYYFPMMALYLQAFTDCLMQDWRGYVDLFACVLPAWEKKRLAFAGLRARGGVEVSGKWRAGAFEVTLKPRGAKSVKVRVSRQGALVHASGQAKGPGEFACNQVVEFMFAGRKGIALRG
jgi:hypothetical protein